jgi:hypothetical protein
MKGNKKCRLTQAFKFAVKDFSEKNGIAQYQIAAKAEIPPSTLSYMLRDTLRFAPGDSRVKRVAKVVSFRRECFEKEV